MTEKSFWEWYNEKEKTTGSLVTPASATKMIGVSRQYVEKLINAGKLKKHYFEDMPFIGMNDINKVIATRNKKIEEENRKDLIWYKAQQEIVKEKIEKIRKRKFEELRKAGMIQGYASEEEEEEEKLRQLESILSEEENSDMPTDHNIEDKEDENIDEIDEE